MGPSVFGNAESGAERQGAAAPSVAHDQALWASFAGARGVGEFCQSWLAIQCRLVPDVHGGLVVLAAEAEGSYAPVAVWPDIRRDMSYLGPAAQTALGERRGSVQKAPEGASGYHIAYPLEARDVVHGAVVLDVAQRSEGELQAALRQLHWGAAQLLAFLLEGEVADAINARRRLETVLELLGAAVGHERFAQAAMEFVTSLATRLDCDRVSIGFSRGGRTRVEAVSHSAEFKERSNLMRSVAEAMDEAIDQRATVAVPVTSVDGPAIVRAHAALAESQAGEAVMSVPLGHAERPTGALTLERSGGRPFATGEIELCQALGAVVGPVLETHWREDRWLPLRAWDWGREKFGQLVGPRHLALKLGAGATVLVLAFLVFGKGEYRASAHTVLEPLVQLAAVAPFDGYIRDAKARPGDIVKQGAILAMLDDRDLRLERLKWLSQQEELLKQYRQAMADRNLAQVEVVSAQLGQARAQLALLDDQLSRTQLTAPFDGVVVSGDLTQSLGAPVERGKVLYEVAPLDAYRIILEVDERDVPDVKVGQTGELLLTAFPHAPFEFVVRSVTPVSTSREGRNYFRVEAEIGREDPRLRPGMEGAAKISIGERRYVWIWTHTLVDWARLKLWSWMP